MITGDKKEPRTKSWLPSRSVTPTGGSQRETGDSPGRFTFAAPPAGVHSDDLCECVDDLPLALWALGRSSDGRGGWCYRHLLFSRFAKVGVCRGRASAWAKLTPARWRGGRLKRWRDGTSEPARTRRSRPFPRHRFCRPRQAKRGWPGRCPSSALPQQRSVPSRCRGCAVHSSCIQSGSIRSRRAAGWP